MNKHAAEKISSEYYNLGTQLALQNAGLLKTANLGNKIIRNTVGAYGGLAGAAAAPAAAIQLGLRGRDIGRGLEGMLSPSAFKALDVDELVSLGLVAPAALATGVLGAKGAVTGYDKILKLIRGSKIN